MSFIQDGLVKSIHLLLSFDAEIYAMVGLSLAVSMGATLLACIVGIPMALAMGLKPFWGKRFVRLILSTAMGIPPVVLGLIVVLLLSRRGPLGDLKLLFSAPAMVLAQFILVLPIIVNLVMDGVATQGPQIIENCKILGLLSHERLIRLMSELKSVMVLAVLTAFGRAISEVGAVMLVGGNIKGHTRVMTTYIATQNSMGAYEASIAMAIILLLIALTVNAIIHALTWVEPKGGLNQSEH